MAREERYAEGRRRLMPVGLVETGSAGRGAEEAETESESPEILVYPVDKGSGATTSLAQADGVVEVPAATDYVGEGERVTVQLFSPDVRPPALFGVGEDDPTFNEILDRLERPRYLSIGSRPALRRLREGVPDVAVVSGPTDREVGEELGRFDREWGLIVRPGNPAGVDGLDDLVDRDLRFVNRISDSGLRSTLGTAIDDLASDRGVERRDLVDSIRGYELGLRAHESPARKVIAGEADAALGLRETAERLDLGFVSLGAETVRVLANPDRTEKERVRELQRFLSDITGKRR